MCEGWRDRENTNNRTERKREWWGGGVGGSGGSGGGGGDGSIAKAVLCTEQEVQRNAMQEIFLSVCGDGWLNLCKLITPTHNRCADSPSPRVQAV